MEIRSEMMDWVICGRLIGKATGWDQADGFVMQIYDLVPAPGYNGPVADCISLDFERGRIESIDREGNITASFDLIEAVKDCATELRGRSAGNRTIFCGDD